MTATAEAAQVPPHALVDPRVAKHGGTRNSSKSTYRFPGLMDQASWRRTEVAPPTTAATCAARGSPRRPPSTAIWQSAMTAD
jgi:hypothetical protein